MIGFQRLNLKLVKYRKTNEFNQNMKLVPSRKLTALLILGLMKLG